MAPNSGFAILLRSPWWVSFAIAAVIVLLWTSSGTMNSPPEGGEQGPQRRGLRPPGPPWACGPPPSTGRLPPLVVLQP